MTFYGSLQLLVIVSAMERKNATPLMLNKQRCIPVGCVQMEYLRFIFRTFEWTGNRAEQAAI